MTRCPDFFYAAKGSLGRLASTRYMRGVCFLKFYPSLAVRIECCTPSVSLSVCRFNQSIKKSRNF